MDKINITIPAGLTKAQEIAAIASTLGKKMLPAKSQLQLEGSYVVGDLETQIIIKREIDAPVTVTRECSVCPTIFDDSLKVVYWNNYGGKPKKAYVCSRKCRDAVVGMLGDGGRVAVSRYKLTPLTHF